MLANSEPLPPREIAHVLRQRGTYRGNVSDIQRALEEGADFHGFICLRGNPWTIRPDMTRDHQHNPDPNQNAARIVRESTAESDGPSADLEAAWAEWSRSIKKVDERGMTLLRAAFEAGWDSGRAG